MRVVCVHGIGQQRLGEDQLLDGWVPALLDGLKRAGAPNAVDRVDVGMAFYGNLFRPVGSRLDVGDPLYRVGDVQEGFEQDLLQAWWAEAARTDRAVVPPGADTLVRTPRAVQTALRALSGSKFFAGIAVRGMVSDLKQVRRYLDDPAMRAQARERVRGLIGVDTRVVVGHSLGSVVAYEVLCERHAAGERSIPALVTLGSPLGIANLVFDRLDPSPVNRVGAWPGDPVTAWTNVVDDGDVVALVKDLRPLFGSRLEGFLVHNGSHAHDVRSYLSDELTGQAIAAGLAESGPGR